MVGLPIVARSSRYERRHLCWRAMSWTGLKELIVIGAMNGERRCASIIGWPNIRG